MSRFTAFAIHLGISLLIFFVLAYLVVFEWYPDIFFANDGGWRGVRIIVAVDLVLGPLLTLVVFKAGKPGLRTDLTLIGLVQMVCLCAGTWVVYSERPLAVVYTEGRFTTMSADDYRAEEGVSVPDLRHFPGNGPKWVAVQMPENETEHYDLFAENFKSGRSMNTLTDYYVPFSTATPGFVDAAERTAEITISPEWTERLTNWLAENGGELEDYAFYVFSTRYVFGYLVYRRASLERIGLITNLDV